MPELRILTESVTMPTANPSDAPTPESSEVAILLAQRIQLAEQSISEATSLSASDYAWLLLINGVLPVAVLLIGGMQ